MNATQEQWRPVVGWEDLYEVSDQGRIRSFDREVSSVHKASGTTYKRRAKGRLITPLFSKGYSYPRVQLCRDGLIERHRVHRLVAQAFLGPCPPGMYVCHWNDVPTDNRLCNLRYAQPSDNMYDRVRNGSHNEASKTHCKRGHQFSADNTYIYPPTGARRCRACKRLRASSYKQRS